MPPSLVVATFALVAGAVVATPAAAGAAAPSPTGRSVHNTSIDVITPPPRNGGLRLGPHPLLFSAASRGDGGDDGGRRFSSPRRSRLLQANVHREAMLTVDRKIGELRGIVNKAFMDGGIEK